MKLFREDTNERVELPAVLATASGDEWHVRAIAVDASPGKSGKLECTGHASAPRLLYPGVFRCYIADEPREPVEPRTPRKVAS